MKVSLKHQTRMFEIAHHIKYWSGCPQGRQHACILTIAGKYIVATGYNGVPKAQICLDSSACLVYTPAHMRSVCTAVHAEVNAIKNLQQLQEGIVAFVTKEPCKKCCLTLRENGVHDVYWQEWHKGWIVDKGYKKL